MSEFQKPPMRMPEQEHKRTCPRGSMLTRSVVCNVYSTAAWPVNEEPERIYYVKAPAEYYGNRLASYSKNLTFSLRSRLGVEVDLAATHPVIIEGGGQFYVMS